MRFGRANWPQFLIPRIVPPERRIREPVVLAILGGEGVSFEGGEERGEVLGGRGLCTLLPRPGCRLVEPGLFVSIIRILGI